MKKNKLFKRLIRVFKQESLLHQEKDLDYDNQPSFVNQNQENQVNYPSNSFEAVLNRVQHPMIQDEANSNIKIYSLESETDYQSFEEEQEHFSMQVHDSWQSKVPITLISVSNQDFYYPVYCQTTDNQLTYQNLIIYYSINLQQQIQTQVIQQNEDQEERKSVEVAMEVESQSSKCNKKKAGSKKCIVM